MYITLSSLEEGRYPNVKNKYITDLHGSTIQYMQLIKNGM